MFPEQVLQGENNNLYIFFKTHSSKVKKLWSFGFVLFFRERIERFEINRIRKNNYFIETVFLQFFFHCNTRSCNNITLIVKTVCVFPSDFFCKTGFFNKRNRKIH